MTPLTPTPEAREEGEEERRLYDPLFLKAPREMIWHICEVCGESEKFGEVGCGCRDEPCVCGPHKPYYCPVCKEERDGLAVLYHRHDAVIACGTQEATDAS